MWQVIFGFIFCLFVLHFVLLEIREAWSSDAPLAARGVARGGKPQKARGWARFGLQVTQLVTLLVIEVSLG